MDILTPLYHNPIEREYECWILNGIEEYFEKTHKHAAIFALSQIEEVDFPADDMVFVNHKFVGLQFKRANLSPQRQNQQNIDYSNLHWHLNSPPNQFEAIRAIPEIYYCLPTFINRKYKKEAIHHSIFWRPFPDQNATNYWYKRNFGNRRNGNVNREGWRWGQFMEGIQRCDIGLISTLPTLKKKITEMKLLKLGRQESKVSFDSLYFLFVEL